jgi:signal peptidase I
MRWPKWSWSGVAGYILAVAAIGVPLAFLQPVTVSGGSMRPALAPGDVVFVARGSVAGVGDIALIHQRGRLPVLHRIVREDEAGALHTRGDANPVEDFELVAAESVRGRVVRVLPAGRVFDRWRAWRNRATLSAQSDSAR